MPRLKPFHTRGVCEAGCDEAGRGCLAGPVVAAAVILPADFDHPLLNDSKQLSEAQREKLRPIIEQYALSWAVSFTGPREIEAINILHASILGMHRALDQLKIRPDELLIDGNRFKPYRDIPHHCIIKGDSIYRSIAAASILAKTHRDEWMMRLHDEFPSYNWKKNKGYPTNAHRDAIRQQGVCEHHRMTFALLRDEKNIK
ncbi:MAG: ribonuclease HII [Crocinitomicaceae bacterium]|nr:ribonuclease HII [Crocinitomicaceae bacterium]